MALFKKKDKVIDLTGYYEKNKEKFDNLPENQPKVEYEEIGISPSGIVSAEAKADAAAETASSGNGFFGGFFGGGSSSSSSTNALGSQDSGGVSDSVNPDERRRKLAKRLGDMTSKIEELSNQIYHLQQRLELVERKLDISKF